MVRLLPRMQVTGLEGQHRGGPSGWALGDTTFKQPLLGTSLKTEAQRKICRWPVSMGEAISHQSGADYAGAYWDS